MLFLSSPILFDKTIRLSWSKFNGFVSLTVSSLYWLVSLFRRQLFPHFISFHLAFIVLLHILPYIYLKHGYLQRSPGVYKGLYHWLSLSFETVQSGFSPSARLASNSLSHLSSGIIAEGPHTLFPFSFFTRRTHTEIISTGDTESEFSAPVLL